MWINYQNEVNLTNNSLSTSELIDKDFEEGRISEGERILYLTYAIKKYENLPEKYHSNRPWEGTMAVLEINKTIAKVSQMCSRD